MIKMINVYSLPEGTDPDEFWKYHTEEHALDVKNAAGPILKKYVINRVIEARSGEPAFFGLIETWWESEEARQEYIKRSYPRKGEFSSRVTGSFAALVEEKEIPFQLNL